MTTNTLLTRCCVAFMERYDQCQMGDDWLRPCLQEVLMHLSAELIVLYQRDERLTVHELAMLLMEAGNAP